MQAMAYVKAFLFVSDSATDLECPSSVVSASDNLSTSAVIEQTAYVI